MLRDGEFAPTPRGSADTPRVEAHADEVELVRRVLAGDESAWREFIGKYSGLIQAVARRYLHSRDSDEVRSIFVDVLVSLRRSKLRTYEGRASLSTWLTLVVRTEVIDLLRRRFGRGRWATGLNKLTETEQLVFRLYYIDGRSPKDVLAELARHGETWTLEHFMAALLDIERRLGSAWLRRLAYDLHAQSTGAASGRLLEYLDHVRDEYQENSGAFSPEYLLMEREARRTTERLTSVIASLDPAERQMIQLRFEQGWTARRIAEELGIPSTRGVYSIIDRVVRKLRRFFPPAGDIVP